MPSPIYLDNCATTKVCEEAAVKAMEAMTENYGNPSSLHTMGLKAENMVRESREIIASTLRCDAGEIYFTSGGTESNNLAVFGAARALRRRGLRIVTTMIEHSSVESAMRSLEKEGFEVIRLKTDSSGSICEDDLFSAVTKDTILVSMMLVNNETGAVLPVSSAAKAVRAVGSPALIHCDAVQAYGKIKISPVLLGADLISLSAHKIYAPKGAGALYVSKKARILPVSAGGGQEKGLRSGTEPVPAIAGFGAAARLVCGRVEENAAALSELKNNCIEMMEKLPFIVINSPKESAPHILNLSIPGIRSEVMLHYLASKGIYVSSGSACGKGVKSRILTAMGLPESRIDSALRISFGRYNQKSDIKRLAEEIERGAAHLARSKKHA